MTPLVISVKLQTANYCVINEILDICCHNVSYTLFKL